MMMIILMTTMAMTDDGGNDSDKLMTNGMNRRTSLVRATVQGFSLPL